MQDLKMGDKKMKYLKMKDQMPGHENAGPQKHDQKKDKLPKVITSCN